jgi:hypothetical protein
MIESTKMLSANLGLSISCDNVVVIGGAAIAPATGWWNSASAICIPFLC